MHEDGKARYVIEATAEEGVDWGRSKSRGKGWETNRGSSRNSSRSRDKEAERGRRSSGGWMADRACRERDKSRNKREGKGTTGRGKLGYCELRTLEDSLQIEYSCRTIKPRRWSDGTLKLTELPKFLQRQSYIRIHRTSVHGRRLRRRLEDGPQMWGGDGPCIRPPIFWELLLSDVRQTD